MTLVGCGPAVASVAGRQRSPETEAHGPGIIHSWSQFFCKFIAHVENRVSIDRSNPKPDKPRAGRAGRRTAGRRCGAERGKAGREAWAAAGYAPRTTPPSCYPGHRGHPFWTSLRKHEQTKSYVNRLEEHNEELKTSCGNASSFTPIRIGWIVSRIGWCPTPEPVVYSWTIPGAVIFLFNCKLANASVGNREVRNEGRQTAQMWPTCKRT